MSWKCLIRHVTSSFLGSVRLYPSTDSFSFVTISQEGFASGLATTLKQVLYVLPGGGSTRESSTLGQILVVVFFYPLANGFPTFCEVPMVMLGDLFSNSLPGFL